MKSLHSRYRYALILLKQLVKTDFKLRYQGSALGYLWSLLRPLALFSVLYVVFVRFFNLGEGISHFSVYLLLGIVLWNYFIEVTTGSINSIVGKGDLLRKLNFPRYVIVLAGSFSALINLLLNLMVVGIFMIIDGVNIQPGIVFFPLIIAELFVFALAMAFFLSAAFVRFRDITYIWEVLMQGAFYATPILYPLAKVENITAQKVLMLNPMAQIIQDARRVVVTPATDTIATVFHNPWIRIVPLTITALAVMVAVVYFRKRSKYFAEDV